MIKVDRGPVPPAVSALSALVINAGAAKITKGQDEARRATDFFSDPANFAGNRKLTKKKFPFVVYKDRALVRALDAAFGPKCAYCESRFGPVMPRDVEHFRPKSEVETSTGKLVPGYYWLAAEWMNLLVSCIDCNRARDQEIAGLVGTAKRGKGTQFPLEDETLRFRGPGPGVGTEDTVRLLLDPCRDDPEEHLTYDDQGFIYARADARGMPSRMGSVSIDVFALQRKKLADERLFLLTAFNFLVVDIRRAIEDAIEAAGKPDMAAMRARRIGDIERIRTQLESMLQPQAAYVGMLRDWIRRAKTQGDLADLLAFGIDLEVLI